VLGGGNKPGLGDLRSAGSETRAERFCYRLLGLGDWESKRKKR
jgi:hypothetical protein